LAAARSAKNSYQKTAMMLGNERFALIFSAVVAAVAVTLAAVLLLLLLLLLLAGCNCVSVGEVFALFFSRGS